MNKGFAGRTMCLADKHRLADPGVLGTDHNGYQYCKACARDRKRRRKPGMCRNCGTTLPIGKTWAFCNTQCEHAHRIRNAQVENIEESRRTLTLMALHAELDRAATSWERADIRAKIAAVK